MTSPSEMKLARCPFCQSSNVGLAAGPDAEWGYCKDCNAEGPWATDCTETDAIAAWNRRPLPPQIEEPEVVGYVSEHTLGELVAAGSGDIYSQEIEQDNIALIRLSDHSAIVEGLEKERDELRREAGELVVAQYAISAAEATILSLTKRLETAEEALKPFAALGQKAAWMDKPDDKQAWGFDWVNLTWGDFRRARSALSPEPGEAK